STPELKGNLTGKLYDYLEAGRPILALNNGPRDQELYSMIEKTGAGFVVDDQTPWAELEAFVMDRYRAWKESDSVWKYNEEYLATLQWQHIVDQFIIRSGITEKTGAYA
ncbi:MAG: hypothetical protein R3330_13315, partial [Saprospiraceae bacterium]|nr:hypothetical protein [Saprospiraceae bacterium]